MKKTLLLFFLFLASSYSQIQNEFHSPQNIKKFADYLFNEKDYLRSAIEYDRLQKNDTIDFKIALAFQQIENYDLALERFSNVEKRSIFFDESQKEYYKTLFLAGRFEEAKNNLIKDDKTEFQRLLYLSFLFTSNELPEIQSFTKSFPPDEQKNILNFYNQKKEPPYKSPLLSGIMSGIIPGSGKIYLGEIGDGITAFLATSVFAFLSYDNFRHHHNFRGWLFSGLGFFFYAGNVYGSVAAAQIYNSKVDYEYDMNLKEYLKNKNYFLPENEFIK